MIVGSSLFIGFAGKKESRRADSNRFTGHGEGLLVQSQA
jgi:hypothetical protein